MYALLIRFLLKVPFSGPYLVRHANCVLSSTPLPSISEKPPQKFPNTTTVTMVFQLCRVPETAETAWLFHTIFLAGDSGARPLLCAVRAGAEREVAQYLNWNVFSVVLIRENKNTSKTCHRRLRIPTKSCRSRGDTDLPKATQE